jgi:glycosyltransferase involved in cell wall biosynthesis
MNYSIVIPTYNSENRITKTLEGIIKAEKPEKYEIIIIDNNCTDKTIEKVKELIPYAKIIKEEKQGLFYARERGILESKYEIIFFIDDDLYISENWFTSFLEIMKKKNIGLAAAKWFFPKEYEVPEICLKNKELFAIQEKIKKEEYFLSSMQCVRKEAYLFLKEKGFKQKLIGRNKYSKYSGGEDIEFSLALRYTPYLCEENKKAKGIHYLEKERLNYKNVVKLKEDSGYVLSKVAPLRYTYKFKYFTSYYYYKIRTFLSFIKICFLSKEERELFFIEKKTLLKNLDYTRYIEAEKEIREAKWNIL